MYQKIRFTSHAGSTSGLILDADTLDGMTVGEVSRLFPLSCAQYMQRLEMSPRFDSWEAAFEYQFPKKGETNENGKP